MTDIVLSAVAVVVAVDDVDDVYYDDITVEIVAVVVDVNRSPLM